jgi:c-di-GMP-binding flagellar brake protein YcgR
MERRNYPRVNVDLPISYLIHSRESGKSFAGTGGLKNISPGGMFLLCPPSLQINAGDMGNFTVDAMLIMQHSFRVKVLGKVVRKELPKENSFDYEMRVQFLSDLNVEFRKVGDLVLNQGKQA